MSVLLTCLFRKVSKMYCLQSFCSICLNNTERLINLNNKDSDDIRLVDKLDFCIPGTHQLYNNRCFICPKCLQNLNTSYEFITLCKTNRTHYDDYLLKLSNNAVYKPQHSLKISLLDIGRCGLLEQFKSNYCNLEIEETENITGVEVVNEPSLLESQAAVWPEMLDHDYCVAKTNEATNTVEINNPESSELTNKKLETINVENDTNLTEIKQEVVDDPGKSYDCNLREEETENITQVEIISESPLLEIRSQAPVLPSFLPDKMDREFCGAKLNKKTNTVEINNPQPPELANKKLETKQVNDDTIQTEIKQEVVDDPGKSQCPACQTYFESRLQFILHFKVRIVHINRAIFTRYKCCTCLKSFEKRKLLRNHILTHRIDQNPATTYYQLPKEPENKIKNRTLHHCKVCSKQFGLKTLFVQHLQTHKIYDCRHCQKKFVFRLNFSEHLKTHFPVHKSSKVFEYYLQNQITMTADLSKYICKYCSQIFTTDRGLASHEIVHYRTYFCQFCNVKFRNKTNLEKHELSHRDKFSNTYYHRIKFIRETNNLRYARPANVRISPRRLATYGEVSIKNPPTGPAKNISEDTQKTAKHTTPNNITMQNETTQTKTVSTKSFPKDELTENILEKHESYHKVELFEETNYLFRDPPPGDVGTSPKTIATNGEILIGPAKNISEDAQKTAKHTTPTNITSQNENTQTKTASTISFSKNELTGNIPRVANQIRDKTKKFVIPMDEIKTKETKRRNVQQVKFQIGNKQLTVLSRNKIVILKQQTQSSPPGVESNEESVPA